MAEKTITLKELDERRRQGVEYQFDPDILTIERFDDLIKALEAMVSNEAERIRADIARNQTNLEILATLQAVIRKQGQGPAVQPVDLSPIRDLLEEIRADRTREPVDYDFHIVRPGGEGFQPATKIEARAVKPTTH